MSEGILTTNVSLNGGYVGVSFFESDNYIGYREVNDGLSSIVVDGFDGKPNGSYSVRFTMGHGDATKSPVVYSASLDVPDVSATVQIYRNGSWVTGTVHVYQNGSWVRANDVKTYDGSSWN